MDEDTSWHFAIGLRSQDSAATRCPCALNKCENSACARHVADTTRRSSYAYFERGEFPTPTPARDRASLPPARFSPQDPSPFRCLAIRTRTLCCESLCASATSAAPRNDNDRAVLSHLPRGICVKKRNTRPLALGCRKREPRSVSNAVLAPFVSTTTVVH